MSCQTAIALRSAYSALEAAHAELKKYLNPKDPNWHEIFRANEEAIEKAKKALDSHVRLPAKIARCIQPGELSPGLKNTTELIEEVNVVMDRAHCADLLGTPIYELADGRLIAVFIEAEIMPMTKAQARGFANDEEEFDLALAGKSA